MSGSFVPRSNGRATNEIKQCHGNSMLSLRLSALVTSLCGLLLSANRRADQLLPALASRDTSRERAVELT